MSLKPSMRYAAWRVVLLATLVPHSVPLAGPRTLCNACGVKYLRHVRGLPRSSKHAAVHKSLKKCKQQVCVRSAVLCVYGSLSLVPTELLAVKSQSNHSSTVILATTRLVLVFLLVSCRKHSHNQVNSGVPFQSHSSLLNRQAARVL